MTLSASERRSRARLGGLTFIANGGDPAELGRRRQAKLREQLAAEVDPDNTMAGAERDRRVDAAIRLRMARLAFHSARARRAHKDAAVDDTAALQEDKSGGFGTDASAP